MPRSLLALAALVALVSNIPFAYGDAQLPPAVARAMARASVPTGRASIYVRDAATNEVVVSLHADEPRSPASVIKVLTTFAALDMLGPGYTWKTRALADGRLENGILHGDLVLAGGGDPYMTSERWWSFVQNLRARGVADISGDVVIDNSSFAPNEEDRAAFDGRPFRSYNVLPDALLVNFQTTRFTITAAPQRSKPQITLNPLPANLVVKNQLRLGGGGCRGYNRGVSFHLLNADDPDTVVLSGVFPAACGSYSLSRAVMSAPSYAYGTFRTLWTQAGGTIDGGWRVGAASQEASLLYEHESLPLPDIIRLINKYSNNVMARHLLLTLGLERFGAPATVENGRRAIRAWLASRDLSMPGLVLDNGCGLSREERITARGLGDLLDVAWRSPFMPEFASSLPLSAIDGTLHDRFDSPGMQGRIRLKTGSIDDVSALAGYVNAASGRTFIVAIIVNHRGAHRGSGEAVQAELVRWVFGQ